MEFKPTYLYIKIHNKTGLKYFGKTSRNNPFSYSGSGIYWLNHMKKHGYDFRTIIYGYYVSEEKCTKDALHFSEINQIVTSNEWANQIPESGIGGTPFSKCHPAKDLNGNSLGLIDLSDPRWISGEIVSSIKGVKKSKEQIEASSKIFKNTSPAKSSDGISLGNISLEDPRWATGEIVSINVGRKLSGETKLRMSNSRRGKQQSEETKRKKVETRRMSGVWHNEETRNKIGKSMKGKQQSEETKNKRRISTTLFRTGTIFITNGEIAKVIKVTDQIPIGFYRGRKTKKAT